MTIIIGLIHLVLWSVVFAIIIDYAAHSVSGVPRVDRKVWFW